MDALLGRSLLIYHIQDWEHFVKLSKKFDKKYKTKTMLFYMHLQEIAHTYSTWNADSINLEWERQIGIIFENSNVRHSSSMMKSEFTHLNNIVSFANSFKQFGFNIVHPIHIHYYPEQSIIHPGNKRIRILYEHYKKPVPVVITDYTRTHKNKGFGTYKFENKNLYYEMVETHHTDKQNRYPMYKELNSAPEGFFNDTSFGKNDHLRSPRIFEYRKNTVFCNHHPILEKVNNKWQTILTM